VNLSVVMKQEEAAVKGFNG